MFLASATWQFSGECEWCTITEKLTESVLRCTASGSALIARGKFIFLGSCRRSNRWHEGLCPTKNESQVTIMNSNEVKQALQKSITQFINAYKTINSLSTSWKLPIVGFADTDSAYILSLREIVSPTHYMPQDFLSDCTVIISYFLPFDTEIGQSNNGNTEPSPTWGDGL